ncbi:cytochrome P450 monooxygenase [Tricladium varicosporioides]|nr:cytochrome P450 monooxygenase [Hymenoscyphus varicosporioides]
MSERIVQQEWTVKNLGTVAIVLSTIYIIGVSVHRLFFSQYAKFPGPKVAGLTYGYMFYYDAIAGDGEYIHKIKKLHEEYDSPIIRISPHELHVNDPDFYDVLFSSNGRRDKPPTWSHAFSNIESVFGTISHDSHRQRRAAVAPFFSPASIRKIDGLIQDKISRLINIFRQYQQDGKPVRLRPAFSALTSDIISEYCFGVDENYTEAENFNAMVLEATDRLTDRMHITVQVQWLPRLLEKLPQKLVETIFGEGMATMNQLKNHCIAKIKETIATRGDYQTIKHRTIFTEILDSKALPEKDKTVKRLSQEAQLLLVAGTVTTANTLSSAVVYLLLNPEKFRLLMEELEEALPNLNEPVKMRELEQLPYLHGVVQESLRLVNGVSYRLVRSAPTETLMLGKWKIPPNTAVSIHAPLIHLSPSIFPQPLSFIPERWLPASTPNVMPGNPAYLMPFSRGSRNCVGKELANAEIYITLAIFLRTFARLERDKDGKVVGVKGLGLFETEEQDVVFARDFGFPSPEKGRGDVRVILD